MGRGYGFGKVILFGEHFVVHGVPGIVSAIDLTVDVEVKRIGEGINVRDERKGARGYTERKKNQQKESIERMLKTMGIDLEKTSLEIWLGGNLPGFSGIGASAASSVAIARAIAEEFEMNLSDERINEIAYEAEKAYAGTPSGIDNTAATYGGLIWFRKNLSRGPNTFERLNVREPVEIIIGNTGVVADTKEMVAGVAERKKKNPEKYDPLFNQAEGLAFGARKALEEEFDLRKVGRLMDENHSLLQEVEVSCKELDYLVNLAREQGAFGAKLTGGGGGGCMVALTPGKELQEAVATAMEKEGFKVLRTKIGIQKYKGNSLIRNKKWPL
ncbi:MAG: mevalonate kinase [Candidatus Bathyarchaeota archaeon]|nr:mevalonate kinase [Candidatus Bathyarchaeota archaeon]